MKNLNTKNLGQKGFSLVELMVVIAIIGVLSAVAVPNYKKYQSKAKTSEAKIQLAGAYAALQTHYGDFSIYSNCLRYMGYDVRQEQNNRYFTIGFDDNAAINQTAQQTAERSGLNGANCAANHAAAEGDTYYTAGKGHGELISSVADIVGSTLGDQTNGSQTFRLQAAGIVHEDFTVTANMGLYQYDEDKIYSILQTGY